MLGISRRASSFLFAAFVGVLGCAPLTSTTAEPSGERGGRSAYRIAVAPVTLAPKVEHRRMGDTTDYAEAATHVGHYLAEALIDRGVDVVPAHDSRGVLTGLARSSDLHRDASRLTRVAVERLGVDALLVVEVIRWAPRDALSRPPSPAAVGFRATLHGGPEGLILWSGKFSERQVSFFESPWRSLRYPGRGTRWLTVTEFARWGARRLAAQIPIASVE